MKELSYLAIKLKEARKKAGVSAAEAGKQIGRSDSTIYAYESDNAEPSAEQLVTLCRLYGVDISFFYPPEASDGRYSSTERIIIERYRKLSDDDKAVLYGVLEILSKK